MARLTKGNEVFNFIAAAISSGIPNTENRVEIGEAILVEITISSWNIPEPLACGRKILDR